MKTTRLVIKTAALTMALMTVGCAMTHPSLGYDEGGGGGTPPGTLIDGSGGTPPGTLTCGFGGMPADTSVICGSGG